MKGHTMSDIAYALCLQCATSIMYADDSGLTEAQVEVVDAWCEKVGNVAYVGPVTDAADDEECACCGAKGVEHLVSPIR